MYTAEDFRAAYEDYAQFNRELYTKASPVSGILGTLGFGYQPGKDPGHQKFLQEMESALKQVSEERPDPETAGAIMDVIFHAREQYNEEQISPYLFFAVEGFTLPIIPFLSKEKAGSLYAQYRKIPFKYHVPMYKQVLTALKNASI